jgi:metal-responsive CopG/Arc/MetJ family transcriptional regulator
LLGFSRASLEGLDELSIKEGMTRSDLIRRAVALYSFAKEEERQGRKLGFFSEEDNRDVVKQVITL